MPPLCLGVIADRPAGLQYAFSGVSVGFQWGFGPSCRTSTQTHTLQYCNVAQGVVGISGQIQYCMLPALSESVMSSSGCDCGPGSQ